MNCKQAKNLFDAYLDGELPSALETELHAHRLQCATCRHDLALLEVAGHVIRSGDDGPRLDADFSDRLLACIEPMAVMPHPARKWIFRIGGALAAAACLSLLVTYIARPGPTVASHRDLGDSAGAIAQPGGGTRTGPPVEPAPADLEEAASAIRESVEHAVSSTHRSSDSLVQLGQATLLQIIDALELEALRDTDATEDQHDLGAQGAQPEDADGVEQL